MLTTENLIEAAKESRKQEPHNMGSRARCFVSIICGMLPVSDGDALAVEMDVLHLIKGAEV